MLGFFFPFYFLKIDFSEILHIRIFKGITNVLMLLVLFVSKMLRETGVYPYYFNILYVISFIKKNMQCTSCSVNPRKNF